MTDAFEIIEFEVSEPADNAVVVLSTRKVLEKMDFDEVTQYLIASAVSELSTNIIRYAHRGTVTLSRIESADKKGIKIVARDQGPGIADISQAMKENHSTGNGLGLGLPSVERIMDEFEISSVRDKGTRIMAVKWMR